MPIHDWSRVNAGIFHSFHTAWIVRINDVLNESLLPKGYYALAEQIAGDLGPDVLTLRGFAPEGPSEHGPDPSETGMTATLAPPKASITAVTEMDLYALRQRIIAIRHSTHDQVVAWVEILSPGNKSNRVALQSFLDKAISVLAQGHHLVLVDLIRPGKRDPLGIHGALWDKISSDSYKPPSGKHLTLASYAVGVEREVKAYVEPVAVGDVLPDMPLFLTPDFYVNLPLEATYQQAWRGVPGRWKTVLEAPAPRKRRRGRKEAGN